LESAQAEPLQRSAELPIFVSFSNIFRPNQPD